jgi:type III secretion protein C
VISSLDIETPLVEIEATVIDVADDKSEQLGIDWRLHSRRVDITSSPNDLAGNGSGTGTGTGRNLANDLLYTGDLLSAGRGLVGTLLFGNERRYFLSRLNALSERGDANLISRPRILTTDNHEAVLQSTKEFYVRVAGREQVDLFNVSLGMVMRVTPTLVEDEQGRRFKLQVRIEDGNTNSGQQVDQIPVVNRNAISTQAIVGDGQSLLIGGYINEERSTTNASVPGLSSIPVLGWLFAQRGNTVRRNERMFMITPRLVDVRAPSENPPLTPAKPVPPADEVTP